MPKTRGASPIRPRPARIAGSFVCSRSPGRHGAAAWVHLAGEFDLASVPNVAEQLREAQASTYLVVVDLRELDFIDCAGLGLLVAADARAERLKKSLVLIRGDGQVGRLLELTGLLRELEVVDVRARAPVPSELAGATDPPPSSIAA